MGAFRTTGSALYWAVVGGGAICLYRLVYEEFRAVADSFAVALARAFGQ
jgi:hypothetical protein